MFERLSERGSRIGARAAAVLIDGLIEAAASELPHGVTAARADNGIVLSGRNLRLRWLDEPFLLGFVMGTRR